MREKQKAAIGLTAKYTNENEAVNGQSAGEGSPASEPQELVTEVRELILAARQTVARGVNAALVALHWQIGQRIRREVLGEKRAEYGEEIVATLSRQLTLEFGGGFAEKNLRRMVQLAVRFFPMTRLSRHCRENWAGAGWFRPPGWRGGRAWCRRRSRLSVERDTCGLNGSCANVPPMTKSRPMMR